MSDYENTDQLIGCNGKTALYGVRNSGLVHVKRAYPTNYERHPILVLK